jgi:hypothetical protein
LVNRFWRNWLLLLGWWRRSSRVGGFNDLTTFIAKDFWDILPGETVESPAV